MTTATAAADLSAPQRVSALSGSDKSRAGAPGGARDGSRGASAAAAALRRLGWRAVFAVNGGMTVRGRMPAGPCVVVANHCSHADGPALIAALPARSRPAVAAAADYWFASPVRATVCRRLVAGFAVRRTGGGSADLRAAGALLRAGRAVVVLPEGTRSRNGELGRFHSGATRLAASVGVPVVPVALVGTARVLAVHGRPHRGHVEVRIGAPMRGADAEAARTAVAALAAEPEVAADSRARVAVARFAASRAVLLAVMLWAFLVALSWPIVPEVAVGVLLLARPRARRAVALTAGAAAGSVAGCLLAFALAAAGHAAPAPLTPPRMHAEAPAQVAREGGAAVAHQPWSGIPVKVYAVAAGRQHVDVATFAWRVTWARGTRLATVAFAVCAVAMALPRRIYLPVVAGALTCFGIGLADVVTRWG